MFSKSAEFYDAIYAWKDYASEAQTLHALIQAQYPAHTLLDVACGTGAHLAFLRDQYAIEGIDLDPQMLAVAQARFPAMLLYQGNMLTFDLGRQFDVVTCLFSSIGYLKTVPALHQGVVNLAHHARPGGLVIVEPWFTPDVFEAPRLSALFVDRPDLKIARISTNAIEDGISILNFNYLVGTPAGVAYFTERHELGLFTHEDYLNAFESAGLRVSFDPQGLSGRGLYVGICS